jgi:hypothetical protein
MASQPSANTLDTLNGLFKEVYAKDLEDLIPDGVKMLSRIPFAKKESSLGNFYHQPVVLGQEHGVTFAGSGDDAFNLNAPVAGQIKDATIRGTQLVLRSVIGYASASRSSEGGAKAFKQATKFLVGNMLRSVTKKLEIELLYGQMGYGTVASSAGSTVTITTSEWAPGIWAGSENMPIEIRDASSGSLLQAASVVQVSFSALSITLDSPVNAAVQAATAPVIWMKGAYGNEFAGIHAVIINTGTLFGINASQYSMWQGNTFSAGSAALSFDKIQSAIALAVEKGLDNDVMVLVNPGAWADLLGDQAALRMYDQSYSPSMAENGSKEIRFHSQNGVVEIVPSIYVKQGYAYVLSLDEMMRIGSTDVTFRRPGKGDEFFRELDNAAGYELRCYCDQAFFCHAPGRNVLINNVVNG